jgi:isopenicillin N synthase-like dioxygenase
MRATTPSICTDSIPVIDLSKPETTVIKELMEAFETIGFVTLTNHGIPQELRQHVFQASKKFFSLPTRTKLKYKYQSQESNRGYIRAGAEHHEDYGNHEGIPDTKETFDIGYELEHTYKNLWPKELGDSEFRSPLLEYFDRMDCLQLKLMKLIAIGLGLDETMLVDKCNGHHENLRLLHYPSLSFRSPSEKAHALSIVRGQPHTDFGSLTLLVQDSVGKLMTDEDFGVSPFLR